MLRRYALTASIILFGTAAWSDGDVSDASEIEVAETVYAVEDVDLEVAAKIFQKSCRACHGNKAQGAASYPKLSDKEPQYVAEKLEIYRSGQKIGPNSILMIQHAKKLSDEDIASISVYVATAFD